MRKTSIIIVFLIIMLTGCRKEEDVVETEKLIGYQIEYEVIDRENKHIYAVGGKEYSYLQTLQGRSQNAAYECYYIVVTNQENITFEDVDRKFFGSDYSLLNDFCIVEYGLIME